MATPRTFERQPTRDLSRRSSSVRLPAAAAGTVAVGAVAFGAAAIGALAVARLAIGHVAVRQARFRTLEIDDLVVHRGQIDHLASGASHPVHHPSGFERSRDTEHPNVSLVRRIGRAIAQRDLSAAADGLADDVVWHHVDPHRPALSGDYHGVAGLKTLLEASAHRIGGLFDVEPVSVAAFGDGLVVAHVRPRLGVDGSPIETDAAVVWRVGAGRITEIWDIRATDVAHPPAR